jgi:hypothetical protein
MRKDDIENFLLGKEQGKQVLKMTRNNIPLILWPTLCHCLHSFSYVLTLFMALILFFIISFYFCYLNMSFICSWILVVSGTPWISKWPAYIYLKDYSFLCHSVVPHLSKIECSYMCSSVYSSLCLLSFFPSHTLAMTGLISFRTENFPFYYNMTYQIFWHITVFLYLCWAVGFGSIIVTSVA